MEKLVRKRVNQNLAKKKSDVSITSGDILDLDWSFGKLLNFLYLKRAVMWASIH